MKVRWMVPVAIAAAAVFFLIGRTTGGKNAGLSDKTQTNLSTAMHGEAFAYAKYLLYAHKAQQSGNPELADLLRETARTERFEHFAEEAELAGLVGSNADNLKNAIKGEAYEVDTMYRDFAKQAAAAGDTAAARRFEEIRKDEIKHRDAFLAALAKLEPNAVEGH